MAAHDKLPPALRVWATQAALPWSSRSLHRLWTRALAETGCAEEALSRLTAAEKATIRREAVAVWGPAYPGHPPDPNARSGKTETEIRPDAWQSGDRAA
jgi:hypothetical protein